ncbi:hypothetical protein N0Y54_07235 [Nostoc punctiforme UO1]|uniref:hypothetical protein n=1 Tax=Nostoc punctiforme TaxID=272131 RepID=UPI0030B70810
MVINYALRKIKFIYLKQKSFILIVSELVYLQSENWFEARRDFAKPGTIATTRFRICDRYHNLLETQASTKFFKERYQPVTLWSFWGTL